MMGDAADTSNRSGSGSAVSYSESCAPYGSDNASEIAGFKGALFRTDLQHNEQTPLLQKNRHSLCCSPPMTRTMDLLPPPPWRFRAAGVRLGEDDNPKPKIHLDLDEGLRELFCPRSWNNKRTGRGSMVKRGQRAIYEAYSGQHHSRTSRRLFCAAAVLDRSSRARSESVALLQLSSRKEMCRAGCLMAC